MNTQRSIAIFRANRVLKSLWLARLSALLCFILPVLPAQLLGQSFTEVASLSGVELASGAWGDYDNDGDLDFLLAGLRSGTGRQSRIYRNTNGTFSNILTADLTNVSSAAVDWGDYDNDGDLDVLLTGFSGSGRISHVYENNGDQTFTEIAVLTVGAGSGGAAWGDYDNDGDLDIALNGFTGAVNASRIFRNNGNDIFQEFDFGLTPVTESSAAWGDYDNDGDLDLLLTGNTGATLVTEIWNNNNGSFTKINAGLEGVEKGAAVWGDYDSDGDLDILLAGDSSPKPTAEVYRNDGNDTFVDINAGLQGVTESAVAWGDFDNDGDLDILLAGRNGSSRFANLYKNNSGAGFSLFTPTGTPLIGVNESTVAWGDYDNDGDLDILLAGLDGATDVAKIYRNNNSTTNTAPTAPANLASLVTGSSVTLSWETSTDGQTPQDGLSYNVRVGTTSNGIQEVSPMANVTTGLRRIPKIGNTNTQNFLTLKNLADGTYFYSAQAIDHGFAGSAFAAEQQFTIGSVANQPPVVASTIANQTLTVGGASFIRDLNAAPAVFNDPDGDALTYAASSSATGIATANISGSTLTVAPVAGGNATITVTANDGRGGTVSTTFTATVGTAPAAPQNLQAIAGDQQVMLTWTANTETDFLRYRIYGGTTPSPTTKLDSVAGATNTTKTITGLTNGTAYFFRITAVNNVLQESGFSNEVSATPMVSFTDIVAPLQGGYDGSVDWGDYDSDGDLDILLTTYTSTECVTKIYRNDAGSFIDLPTPLTAACGSTVWGDYDNDGDLDILLTGGTGRISPDRITKLYRYDGGNFVEVSTSLPNVWESAVAWGDYDNDGDLDILLTGQADVSPGRISRVYRNDGGNFVNISAPLVGVLGGSVAWGDYDNDGDLDILLTGSDAQGSSIAKIYRNDAGNFTDTLAPLAKGGSATWGDYDNDGDLDILLAGASSAGSDVSKIYRNDGGNFVDISASIMGARSSSARWGDYDNDGDLDILLAGLTGVDDEIAKVYRNDAGSFIDISAPLEGVFDGAIAWADYDNDGDLDILLNGDRIEFGVFITKIYRNNIAVKNTAPKAPTNLTFSLLGTSVTLNWDKSTDNETPQNGLTYNFRLGKTPGGSEVVSPMASVSNGYRRVVRLGNTNQRNSWTIKNLSSATYYWSVQAIDHAFAGSAFAGEQIFSFNRLPIVVNAIVNQTLNVGGPSFIRNLNASPAVFSDPDGDALTYTASSSAPTIATASISGTTLTVTPVSGGSVTITVTANDGKGGAVSTTFTVTVNRAPVVANPFSNQTLTVGGSSFVRDLNASPTVFNDPDGDALTYTATSNATTIATANISGSTLTVATVAVGNATITVTANDGKGGSVSTTFSVTVGTAPNQAPTVANPIANQNLSVGGASFTRNLIHRRRCSTIRTVMC